MTNNKNLIPFNKRTENEQREIAKKGGIKSGEVRRNKKTLRNELEIALSLKDETGEELKMSITKALIKKAISGDVKAYIVIRDTIGEKPTDKQEIQKTTPIIIVEDIEHKKMLEELYPRQIQAC